MSKMGEEVVYYNLYHKEASFYLDVCPQLLNSIFLILSLSSPQHITIQHTLFCPFQKKSIKRQESLKLIEWIMIEYINSYKDHNYFYNPHSKTDVLN